MINVFNTKRQSRNHKNTENHRKRIPKIKSISIDINKFSITCKRLRRIRIK